jgi:uncharacterized membrane protein
VFFSPKRKTDSATTRKADLRPRRLFDFVSPTAIGLALLVYVAFVVLIFYLRQFDFPWFGGYANIVGITAMNLGFAAIAFRYLLYGKRNDPYQTSGDRLRVIELSLKLLVSVSIIATLFVTLAISLRALDLPSLFPVAQSLFLQLITVIVFRAFRIDNVDFEVYKEDSLAV